MLNRNVIRNVCLVGAAACWISATATTVGAQQVILVDPSRPANEPATVLQPTVIVQPATQPVAAAAAQPVYQQAAPAGDAYGFVGWLNSTRAQYGLPAVGYDPNLEAWAASNNGQQNARGMGHHVMGPARRQNCAMGNYANIGAMWMASPAHRAALLDPTISFIGIAGAGAYWTFNAY